VWLGGLTVALLIALALVWRTFVAGTSSDAKRDKRPKAEASGTERGDDKRSGGDDRRGSRGTTAASRPSLPSGSNSTGGADHKRTKPTLAEANRSGTITYEGFKIVRVVSKLVDECYALARRRVPGLKGRLEMSVRLMTAPGVGNLIAKAELDKKKTTVTDKELLRCATENVFAAEELLEKLKEQGDPTGGNIVLKIQKQFPPPPKKKPDWPADDSSPVCADGTKLAGTHGKMQWCERPDGKKHGDQYIWGAGKLRTIMQFKDGSSDSARMRPHGI